VIARALVSWLPIDQSSPLYQVLFRVTEPICEPQRRIMPNTGMMDLSPIAAIVILIVLGYLVTGVTAA
jgi:YggT family protein